jgi:PleD family two-component response regulator
MTHDAHSSLGKTVDSLNTLVICAQRSTMLLTRSMLAMTGVKSVAAFDNTVQALNHMISYHIDLVLIDAECAPISGLKFVKVMRHRSADPLCFVPVILTCGQPTPKYVNQAMKMGAHLVLHRPFSTTMLRDRLLWILADKRKMYLHNDRWRIEGVDELLQNSAQNTLLPVLMSQLGLGTKTKDDTRMAEAMISNILGEDAERSKAAASN